MGGDAVNTTGAGDNLQLVNWGRESIWTLPKLKYVSSLLLYKVKLSVHMHTSPARFSLKTVPCWIQPWIFCLWTLSGKSDGLTIISSWSEQRQGSIDAGTHYLFPSIGVSHDWPPKHLTESQIWNRRKRSVYETLITQATPLPPRLFPSPPWKC